jgi:hypothetical protein
MSVILINRWIVQSPLCAFHWIGFVTSVSVRILPWACISGALSWWSNYIEKVGRTETKVLVRVGFGLYHQIWMPLNFQIDSFPSFLESLTQATRKSSLKFTTSNLQRSLNSIVNMFERWKGIEAWKVLALCHMTSVSSFGRNRYCHTESFSTISFIMTILMRHSLTSQFVVPALAIYGHEKFIGESLRTRDGGPCRDPSRLAKSEGISVHPKWLEQEIIVV